VSFIWQRWPPMGDEEITRWLSGLARGDDTAVQRIWQQYYEQLVRLARRKLGDARRRAADEEDVAQSAFFSFCRGAAAGRFPRLDDRHDLWKLLVTITARKATAQTRRDRRKKRGGGGERGESVFAGIDSDAAGIAGVMGNEPTPEVAAAVAEECRRLLGALPDALRQLAMLKLEGYSNVEIAAQLDCAPRTVERKLAKIREVWGE
jgi:RNA polymerase sigma factor (sigma-70 family)